MTGSKHANYRSARSPRPTPEGPARDNPIAGPRTVTTRSEPSAPASAGASGRHKEPGSLPASACPTQAPSQAGGASPRHGERHHGVGKADWSSQSDQTGRGAAHHAGPPGTAERHAAGQNQGTRTGAKQQPPPGAANPGSEHNTQRTTASEQVPGNTKPSHHKPQPGVAGYKRGAHTGTHTHPDSPARSGGAQPKPEPQHTHSHSKPQPGVARYKRSAHTNTHKPQHPSQE